MGKKKNRQVKIISTSPPDLLDALYTRAAVYAVNLGHTLTGWTAAKKKFGRDARVTMCKECGLIILATPYGDTRERGVIQRVPGIVGSALTERCHVPQPRLIEAHH